MEPEPRDPSLDRMLFRRDPESSVQRSYLLSLAAYEGLVTEGYNPETVAEAELFRRAKHVHEYDALGRVTRDFSRLIPQPPTVYTYSAEGN